MNLRKATSVIVVLLALAAYPPATIPAEVKSEPAAVKVIGPTDPISPGLPIFLNTSGVVKGEPYSLFIVPAEGQFLVLFDTDDKPVGIYSNTKPGSYTAVLVAYDAASKAVVKSLHTIVIGGPVPPGPTPPVPPGPTPPVPPGPTPPVVEGKRAILIVHESADETPAVGSLIVSLRNPPTSTYLKDKGHTLSVLDDDATDENGKPAPALEAWRPFFKDMKLPAVFVIDPNGNKLLAKESLPADAKADDVLKIVKANGG